MIPVNERLLINKQALIEAVLELERQETRRTLLMWEYLTSLETLVQKLRDFVLDTPGVEERYKLLEVLQPGPEWTKVLTDELLEQWEAEFKAGRERDAHPQVPCTPESNQITQLDNPSVAADTVERFTYRCVRAWE